MREALIILHYYELDQRRQKGRTSRLPPGAFSWEQWKAALTQAWDFRLPAGSEIGPQHAHRLLLHLRGRSQMNERKLNLPIYIEMINGKNYVLADHALRVIDRAWAIRGRRPPLAKRSNDEIFGHMAEKRRRREENTVTGNALAAFRRYYPDGGDLDALHRCFVSAGSNINREGVRILAHKQVRAGNLTHAGRGIYRWLLPLPTDPTAVIDMRRAEALETFAIRFPEGGSLADFHTCCEEAGYHARPRTLERVLADLVAAGNLLRVKRGVYLAPKNLENVA